MEFIQESMNDHFEKFHIKGLPFNAAIHHFKSVDPFEFPHDHPWDFTTYVISGGYIEKIYDISNDGTWYARPRQLVAGNSYFIRAEHIHKIIDLPYGDCWTLCVYCENKRECRFWDFSSEIAKSRLWNEQNFK